MSTDLNACSHGIVNVLAVLQIVVSRDQRCPHFNTVISTKIQEFIIILLSVSPSSK